VNKQATFFCRSGILVFLLLTLCQSQTGHRHLTKPPLYTYRVLHSFPHDANAFTQGLVLIGGKLYESTGQYGQSSVRVENPQTGMVLQEISLPNKFFGEGLTDWGNTLIQLTWQENTVLVYDRNTLQLLKTLPWPKEGWGLTHDDKHLILSDGSATLYFLDPATLQIERQIVVRDRGKEIRNLNELEYVRGEIFANVWHEDRIVRIAPAAGEVLGWIDLNGLLSPVMLHGPEDVLNGIAFDASSGHLFVTGKRWPLLFEIQVIPK
jgi:glutaminyl-peptide cyclotransferase